MNEIRPLETAAPPANDVEWRLRVDLAAAYRLVDYFGWCELIYGHLTARVPGPDAHFLINAYGLNYDEVTASNLVKIGIDGEIVGDRPAPVNKAGFIIHSAFHMHDAAEHQVVMHIHSRAGMAVAALAEGLQPVSMNATMFTDRLSYHDYEGVSLYPDERARLVENLGTSHAMILRNHGLIVCGRTIPEAFLRLYRLERACQVQIDAAGAGALNLLSDAIARKSGDEVEAFGALEAENGRLEFDALRRKLDRIDGSYAT